MTSDFPTERVNNLGLRIIDGQLDEYTSFFTQKCIGQRQYAGADTCASTELAFEYDERWYFPHSQLAPHKFTIEDDTIDRNPE